MRMLVVYATKMGGTRGLAETVADQLRADGHDVALAEAGSAPDPGPFDAVIVGGALYMLRWHADAKRFVRRHAKVLRTKPVWLFSSGPLDDSAAEAEIPPVKGVAALLDRIGARGHATFGGWMPADAKGFIAKSMADKQSGDWRDMDRVRAWADAVSRELETTVGA
jgi:menaquinone-dependent protoporphyrinogen oxidase